MESTINANESATKRKEISPGKTRRKLFTIRLAFVCLWLLFSGVIFIIAILTDINWTRPNLEAFMCQALHRNVKLGRLQWHFGFKGLSVETSRLLIAEHSGEPFLMANDCNIGISFWSLLLGQIEIRHFDLQNPLFMAMRTGENSWNFDDLLVACPEVDFIDCHHGHVFVVDRKPASKTIKFPDTELSDVEIKLHRAGHFSPAQVQISFVLSSDRKEQPRFLYTANLWGSKKDWWQRNCQFHLRCQSFSLQNWQALLAVVCADKQNSDLSHLVFNPFIHPDDSNKANKLAQAFDQGIFDIDAQAEGAPTSKLNVDLKIKAHDLAYSRADKKHISISQLSLSSKLYCDSNCFKVNSLAFRIPDDNLLFNCKGELKKVKNVWTTNGEVIGLLGDMDKLSSFANLVDLILPQSVTISDKILPDGKLFFDLKFLNSSHSTDYGLEATVADCNINRVIPWIQTIIKGSNSALSKSVADFEQMYLDKSLTQLCLSRQAKFAGTLSMKSNDGLTLKDCILADGSIAWKLSGNLDQNGHWSDLQVTNKDLQLSQLTKVLNNNPRINEQIKRSLGLRNNCDIAMSGKAQLTAKLDQDEDDPEKTDFNCQTILSDADVRLSNPPLNLYQLSGSYATDSQKVILKNIQAKTASGNISIDANIPTNHQQPINFHMHSHGIDLPDLMAVLQLLHMDAKFLTDWHLSGRLKELDLTLSGPTNDPSLHLTVTPEDMIFAFPGSELPMHASAGKVTYSKDALILDKLSVSGPSANYVISLTMKNPSNISKLESMYLSIANAELGDLQTCFSSRSMPIYFKNLLSSASSKYLINGLKGKVSGTLEYGHHGEQHLHGSLDLDNASLHYGQHKLFCHNLKGKVIFAGNDLIFHGITGNASDSSISLESRLNNYESRSSQWHSELTAQIIPSDISDFVSLLGPAPQSTMIKGKAKKSIALKLKSHIAQSDFSHSFTLSADPDTSLFISYNQFNFQQPANTKLTISGACHKDAEQLLLQHLAFDFSGNLIMFKGGLRNTANGQVANLTAQIPEYTQASLLEQAFCPNLIAGEVTGQIKGALDMQGPTNALATSGKISLLGVSAPDLYLTDITGDLNFQPSSSSPSTLQTSLQLKKLNLGLTHLSHASGTINYSSPIYVLNDFNAKLAAGQLKAAGKLDTVQQKANVDLDIKGVQLEQLWPQITTSVIDVDGPLDCSFKLDSSGASAAAMEANLTGGGTIHVGQGSFNRSGQLHARLGQVNLLHQGIFGFNVNNLLQSVVPPKTSDFYSIDGSFGLNKEMLTVRRLVYDSKDLKFSAAGKADLSQHNLELDVAGIMPRVSSSVIHGPIGEISREITLQKFLDSVTLHKLDKLPSLPLIGSIGSRTDLFTCRIDAPYNQPKAISQSIQKSFQWLNYKQANAPNKHAQ